jgi:hypothetical protein
MTISYNPEHDINEKWISTVTLWIKTKGEVLIILRYLCAAGQKDYAIFNSFDDLMMLIERLPTGTDVIAIYDHKFPVRGKVDDLLINNALSAINDDEEFLIVATDRNIDDKHRITGADDIGHNTLIDYLDSFSGEMVAVGKCPAYHLNDHDNMISFSKDGIDGPR